MRIGPAFALFLACLSFLASGPASAASPALELQIELEPATRHFKAQALVTPASRDFVFALHESLEITAATADGSTLRVIPTGSEGSIRSWRIRLPATATTLRLDYGGTLPALDRKLDHRGVLQGLPPMVSNDGSFLPAGGAWYPQPAPFFTYRVTLSVPAGQRALVPGRLQPEEIPSDSSGRYRASFDLPHPTDGIDLMAGPWIVRQKTMARSDGGAIRLRTYFFPDLDGQEGLADGYLDDAQRYLELYSKQIGPYPFTEFSVVASPLPTGLGMPTLTYLGADVLKLPFIRATSLGHEVLHNWWGNGVYVDYARGNWSEGLTTFMADYAYKEQESAQAAREMRLGWLRDFAAVPTGKHQSLASFRSRTHGAAAAVGYGKSAMVFVMLRDTIGEEAFQHGLQAFWYKHRFKVARWDDLQRAFEESSGRSLGGFFNQWVNRAGGPAVKITRAHAQSSAGKPQLTLALEQSEPAYHLRLPIELNYPGRVETRWIDAAHLYDTATLEIGPLPETVRLDPELRVWRVLEPEQLPPILRQWIITPSPRMVLVSASADLRDSAQSLGQRLFETPPRGIALEALPKEREPTLLVGLHADIDDALARTGLPSRPVPLAGEGTAQVWTIQPEVGPPVAVVSARDADALRALQRPLPHYGSQSWLIFDGGRVVKKGVWPAPGRPIPVQGGR